MAKANKGSDTAGKTPGASDAPAPEQPESGTTEHEEKPAVPAETPHSGGQ
jgi:hypothetical protein